MTQPSAPVTYQRAPDVQRATFPYALHTRAARQVTRGVTAKLSLWQAKIARLRGLVEHRGSPVGDTELRHEIESLAGQIRAQQAAFHAVVHTLPREIAAHDQIIDTQRALSRAAEVLADIGASPEGR